MEKESSIPIDATCPYDMPDGCKLLLNNRECDLTAFLFKDEICPISSLIRKKIEPTKDTPSQIERCFNIFLTIYKTRSQYFIEKPIFTILYSSRSLISQTTLSMTASFIRDYINELESMPDVKVLDYLIPFTIFKKGIEDKSSTVVPFMLFLCEKFGTHVFMPHFLNVLEQMTVSDEDQAYEIQNFHIELLTAVIQSFDLNLEEIDEIETKILIPLQYDETVSIKLACAALGKVIDSTPSRKNSAPSSPLRDPKPIPSEQLNFDKLNSYLDEIDSNKFISPAVILGNIKTQIELIDDWPINRSFIPLFQLSMRCYRKSNEINRANIFFIVSFINHKFYKKLEEMLKLYIDAAHDHDSNLEFTDKCYQEFLNLVYSDRDLSESSTVILENAPLNLMDNPPQKIKSTHNSLTIAANNLKDWNTAYDGVLRIWREITKNPDVNLFLYLKDLEFSKITYLYQGLREIAAHCEPILGVDHALLRVQNYMNMAEQEPSPSKKRRHRTPASARKRSNQSTLSTNIYFTPNRSRKNNAQ